MHRWKARNIVWWLLCKHTVYVTGMIWREKRLNRVFLAFKKSSLTAQHDLQASPGLKAHSLKQFSLASHTKHSLVERSFQFKLNKLTVKLSTAVAAPCLSDKLQTILIGEEMVDYRYISLSTTDQSKTLLCESRFIHRLMCVGRNTDSLGQWCDAQLFVLIFVCSKIDENACHTWTPIFIGQRMCIKPKKCHSLLY